MGPLGSLGVRWDKDYVKVQFGRSVKIYRMTSLTYVTEKLLVWELSLQKQYFIVSEPKVEVISSKIDCVAAIYTSKFKWAWRPQFLSHTLQILEIN